MACTRGERRASQGGRVSRRIHNKNIGLKRLGVRIKRETYAKLCQQAGDKSLAYAVDKIIECSTWNTDDATFNKPLPSSNSPKL
jgi:hypothetical protein